MSEPQVIHDYRRVAKALAYVDAHVLEQPTLESVAEEVGLSQFHFQRLFSRWVGISPKRFLQAITVERARKVLLESKPTLDAALSAGLSGTGRLHDLFITLEGVPPGAYLSGGRALSIRFGVAPSPYGYCFVARSDFGLCRLELSDSSGVDEGVGHLRIEWPEATLTRSDAEARQIVARVFEKGAGEIPIRVRGTNFQIQVWRALLAIAPGSLATYGEIAAMIGRGAASRAVGNAVGANPVAYLIPCHRVIRKLGESGGYRWGVERKRVILAGELAGRGEAADAAAGSGPAVPAASGIGA